MVITFYGYGSNLCHATWIIYVLIGSPFIQMLHVKFGCYWTSSFREDIKYKRPNGPTCINAYLRPVIYINKLI